MKFSTAVCATVAALMTLGSADEGICQRGWYRYAGSSAAMGEYDGAADFKACEGRKYSTSDQLEYGKWLVCSEEDVTNGTTVTTVTNVYERYYDSFKCNDGNRLNSTLVGRLGDLSDSAWVSAMEAQNGAMFMLFDEDETYCYAAGTVECRIETNTIVELSSTAQFTCAGTEWYREKNQMPTRRCYYGRTFNCTGDESFDMTVFENADCTGGSATYQIDSGCNYRSERFWNGTTIVDGNAQDELRILKCHACAPYATVLAFVAALLSAFAY